MFWQTLRSHIMQRAMASMLTIGGGSVALYIIGAWLGGSVLNPVRELYLCALANITIVDALFRGNFWSAIPFYTRGMTAAELAQNKDGLGDFVVFVARMGMMLALLHAFPILVLQGISLLRNGVSNGVHHMALARRKKRDQPLESKGHGDAQHEAPDDARKRMRE